MKKLKLIFQCDNYTELADILGVRRTTIYKWKNYEMPEHIKSLLNLIEKQQAEIIKFKEISDNV